MQYIQSEVVGSETACGSLGIFRLGSFAGKLSLGNFRSIIFAWDLSLVNFLLGTFARSLGNFRLGNSAPEAGELGS